MLCALLTVAKWRVPPRLASHYFRARLPQQFDLVIHLDQTTAVQPF